MCLAVPGQIVSIEGPQADVDFGGVLKKVNVSLIEGHVGDWVVVHAGFAIETMDEEEAQDPDNEETDEEEYWKKEGDDHSWTS